MSQMCVQVKIVIYCDILVLENMTRQAASASARSVMDIRPVMQ